jgi:hypothetical protein
METALVPGPASTADSLVDATDYSTGPFTPTN